MRYVVLPSIITRRGGAGWWGVCRPLSPPHLNLSDSRSRVNRVWCWAVVARWTVLLLSAAAAADDDDVVLLYRSFPLTWILKGVCAGGWVGREKVINKKKKKTHGTVIHRTGVFRRLRNAAISASLTVCGRAFQSLEAELVHEHIGEWVPASIPAPYPRSICKPRACFCDQFAVSLATNAVLSRRE